MTDTTVKPIPHVYTAIAKVMELISKDGISKGRKNEQQGYKFRGIDDVYNALAPILTEAGLCILPKVTSRDVIERQTRNGGALFYVTVHVDFHLVSAKDASWHQISVVGEAMDSGDKATNKAMSAAYKYACMQAFCIPTEGDNDADSKTYEVAASTPVVRQAPPPKIPPKVANGAVIGADELGAITKLASSAGVELSAIAAAYDIASIGQLPLTKTAEVIDKLQKRIADAQTKTA